ncbi:endolytic transglycosylase MltG [Candidatus Latescibacterota bacterium]
MISSKRTIIVVVTLAVISCVVIIVGGWLYWMNLPTGKCGSITVEIKPGMNAGEIAKMLDDMGVIKSASFFRFISERRDYSRKFKAGKHPVSGLMTMSDIARLLTNNPPPQPDIVVTVIEGLNIKETASVLAAGAGIDSAAFVEICMDGFIADQLRVDNDTLEGYLYPDTYFIRTDTEPLEMVNRMVNRFHEIFNDSLMERASEIGMTKSEIVTLASLIEAEVSLDEERSLVSSVFHRRLKFKRPLESNSTIQYALGIKRRVLHEDLEIDSPYNTYINPGLPPAPIACPGRKSLLAALNPAETKYLYFVADGNGGHVFSRTLSEHNRAVRSYKRNRRQSSIR